MLSLTTYLQISAPRDKRACLTLPKNGALQAILLQTRQSKTIFTMSVCNDGSPLSRFTDGMQTLAHIQLYGSYHNNLEFCREYEAKHGHAPLVNPLVKYKW